MSCRGSRPLGYPEGFSPSAAFQQVKQTQASLARLTRASNQQQQQQQLQQQQHQQQGPASSQTNPSSQQKEVATKTTFVDCLIRRFKDCFNEDCCTVPMFVVGNLSPGSDGTHLILPPCVSLSRQNLNRFASPKNLRHLNSIRESCKSIEELDLGGNKLSDLIEVYKILQCAPNLRFLNLSENDLSKAAPVAMATATTISTASLSSSSSSSSVTTTPPSFSPSVGSSFQIPSSAGLYQWTGSSPQAASHWPSRACLAPIDNQSNRPTAAMSSRRHSTLSQSASARLTEARRMAAAAALAQSKKTSSSVATKLASKSASVTSGSNGARRPSAEGGQRHIAPRTPSTMNLARSLSSLSAKDVRPVQSQASRNLCNSKQTRPGQIGGQNKQNSHLNQQPMRTLASSLERNKSSSSSVNLTPSKTGKPTSGSKIHSFASDTIAENDVDIDMTSEQVTNQQVASPASQQLPNQQQPSQPNSQLQQRQQGKLLSSHQTFNQNSIRQTSLTGNSGNSSYKRTFESIRELALNNTGCPWKVVCSILNRMPNLEELHLSLNNYERIDLEPNEFKHLALKRLYLCNNPKLTNWRELDKLLLAFPSLEALSIADCNISQIPDNLAASREWRKLCGLNINGWPIKEWPIIERLNQLPSLIDLKCRNIDILNNIEEPRHHLIARLPKLKRLNGSEIEEREHAEKAFLRFFMTNSHLERPSRFHELIQIHGEIIPVDVDVDLSPPSQAQVRVVYLNRNHYRKENEDDILMSEDFLIKLMDNVDNPNDSGPNQSISNVDSTIELINKTATRNEDSDIVESGKPVRLFKDEGQEIVAIEVDLRQSVRKFKTMLASLFGLQSQNLILYYIDHEMVGLMGPELIKHNQKKLWNYSVQDGDQFIVEER